MPSLVAQTSATRGGCYGSRLPAELPGARGFSRGAGGRDWRLVGEARPSSAPQNKGPVYEVTPRFSLVLDLRGVGLTAPYRERERERNNRWKRMPCIRAFRFCA